MRAMVQCSDCGVIEYADSAHSCGARCECGQEKPIVAQWCNGCRDRLLAEQDEPVTELVPQERVSCPHCNGDVDDGTHEVYCSKEDAGARIPEGTRDLIVQARARILQLDRMMKTLVQRQGIFPSFAMFADAMLKEFEDIAETLKV